MNPPLDLEHVVTDWLRKEASASGSDRVLAAALGRVSTVGQERRRPTWMHMPMSPTLKAATWPRPQSSWSSRSPASAS